jgi:hypothetical protein
MSTLYSISENQNSLFGDWSCCWVRVARRGWWEALAGIFGEDVCVFVAWWYGLVRRGGLDDARV